MIAALLSLAFAGSLYVTDIPEFKPPEQAEITFTLQMPASLAEGMPAPYAGILVEPAFILRSRQYKIDLDYWEPLAYSMRQGRVDDRKHAQAYVRKLRTNKILSLIGVGAASAGVGIVVGSVLK